MVYNYSTLLKNDLIYIIGVLGKLGAVPNATPIVVHHDGVSYRTAVPTKIQIAINEAVNSYITDRQQ